MLLITWHKTYHPNINCWKYAVLTGYETITKLYRICWKLTKAENVCYNYESPFAALLWDSRLLPNTGQKSTSKIFFNLCVVSWIQILPSVYFSGGLITTKPSCALPHILPACALLCYSLFDKNRMSNSYDLNLLLHMSTLNLAVNT